MNIEAYRGWIRSILPLPGCSEPHLILLQNPENLLDFVDILQQELIRAGVLPEDYDFEVHKKLVPMQPGDVPVIRIVLFCSCMVFSFIFGIFLS